VPLNDRRFVQAYAQLLFEMSGMLTNNFVSENKKALRVLTILEDQSGTHNEERERDIASDRTGLCYSDVVFCSFLLRKMDTNDRTTLVKKRENKGDASSRTKTRNEKKNA
jgi:hypothetical protein